MTASDTCSTWRSNRSSASTLRARRGAAVTTFSPSWASQRKAARSRFRRASGPRQVVDDHHVLDAACLAVAALHVDVFALLLLVARGAREDHVDEQWLLAVEVEA